MNELPKPKSPTTNVETPASAESSSPPANRMRTHVRAGDCWTWDDGYSGCAEGPSNPKLRN